MDSIGAVAKRTPLERAGGCGEMHVFLAFPMNGMHLIPCEWRYLALKDDGGELGLMPDRREGITSIG